MLFLFWQTFQKYMFCERVCACDENCFMQIWTAKCNTFVWVCEGNAVWVFARVCVCVQFCLPNFVSFDIFQSSSWTTRSPWKFECFILVAIVFPDLSFLYKKNVKYCMSSYQLPSSGCFLVFFPTFPLCLSIFSVLWAQHCFFLIFKNFLSLSPALDPTFVTLSVWKKNQFPKFAFVGFSFISTPSPCSAPPLFFHRNICTFNKLHLIDEHWLCKAPRIPRTQFKLHQ